MHRARWSHRVTAAVVAATLTVLAAAACARKAPTTPGPPSTEPTASAAATASASPSRTTPPTPTIDPGIIFSADGIGPFQIGGALADLQADGLLTDVSDSSVCANVKIAAVTGRYEGQLTLTFRLDLLVAIYTNSPVLRTPSGGHVGLPLTEMQSIYGSRGSLITGELGNQGFLVRVPGTALAVSFLLDSTTGTVSAMGAGEAQPLEDAILSGEGC